MVGEKCLKCFVIFALTGLAVAKFDVNKLNFTTLHKTFSSSQTENLQPYEWDPDFCNEDNNEEAFPHPDSCKMYLICWNGELWEDTCDPGQLFDPWGGFCDDADFVTCLDNLPGPPSPDDECPPPGSNEIRFLPSVYCEEFYICINGQPILLFCRPGQHWNIAEEFCDDPSNAGCDADAGPSPDRLPDCPAGFTGQLPHPHNCNWFIHCSNGSRSIQQCQHLHHFDVDQRRCLFKHNARCVKEARSGR